MPIVRCMMLCFILLLASLNGCGPREHLTPATHVTLENEPVINVRIHRGAHDIKLESGGKITLTTLNAANKSITLTPPIQMKLTDSHWHLEAPHFLKFPVSDITLRPEGRNTIRIENKSYPGDILLHPIDTFGATAKPKFDAVNRVKMEQYLPGVLEQELYDYWLLATFHAQAIAARSYAIIQIMRNPTRHFHVESTTTSQAYVGMATNPRATQAVKDTTGLVLTWNNKIIPAYYSSTKGDIGQSAADAFGEEDIPPLRATKHAGWAKASPLYNWGPITRDNTTLTKRLKAYGTWSNHPIKNLDTITAIRVHKKNVHGRPMIYRVFNSKGNQYEIKAEQLRVAANFRSKSYGAPELPVGTKIHSSFFEVQVKKSEIIFKNGHGFGHGIGLCQYGAQGMAEAGRDGVEILEEYYPEAKLERAY